jgi:hydroxymethylpyrimidine/phosphomethylpyrimidine kinase
METQKIALTIAGSDPTGGAGFQADLKTFKAMGVYGLSIPSVLTAQNTLDVATIHELPPEFFLAQIDMLLKDIRPDALKTGMLYNSDMVNIVVEKIKEYSLKNLVVDPVMVSTSGIPLTKGSVLETAKKNLLPLSKVITPNTYEASVLTGIDVQNEKDAKEAAVKLRGYGTEAVIITGGHLREKPVDVFFDGEEFLSIENDGLEGEFHGTGCVFSAAITSCLALGYDVKEAFIKAKEFTFNAMKSAVSVGRGMKVLNV